MTPSYDVDAVPPAAEVPAESLSSDPWLPTTTLRFPDGFLWGTANAAHQVEGGNVNNDWWEWEHDPDGPCVASSGDATDAWHRYPEDLDLCAAGGGQNVHRFSVEWSRIEPAEGEFSQVALDHYRRLCDDVLARGMQPMVTFHHFTTPRWVSSGAVGSGAWEDPRTADRFARFVETTAAALGPDRLPWACTLNEPGVVATMGWFLGMFPPGVRDPDAQARATATMLRAHAAAVPAIKAAAPDCRVGVTLAMMDIAPADPTSDADVGLAGLFRHRFQDVYVDALATGEVRGLGPAVDDFTIGATSGSVAGDFVGCQYYQRLVLDATVPTFQRPEPDGAETTLMGQAVWPPGLAVVLRRLRDAGLPVVITENGMATADDRRRCAWIAAHLAVAHGVMREGLDLRGYLYWSTTDNFEWALGYGPTFGLIGIDRDDGLARVPRPSLSFLNEIAVGNALDPAVVDRYVNAAD